MNTPGHELTNNHIRRGQETNQIRTQEAGTHDTHDRGLTWLPPPKRLVPSINSSIGRGGGRSGSPSGQTRTRTQDGDLQSRTDRDHGGAGSSGGHGVAGSSGGHVSAGSSGGHGRWCSGPWPQSPRPSPYSRNPFTPPKFPWGSQEPSGARQTGQYITWKSPPGPDRQDKTGHPTGTRSSPGLAWKLRLPLGMTRSQGPSQGPSATASTSATGRQPQASLRGQDKTSLYIYIYIF